MLENSGKKYCKLIEQVYVNILYICMSLNIPTPCTPSPLRGGGMGRGHSILTWHYGRKIKRGPTAHRG